MDRKTTIPRHKKTQAKKKPAKKRGRKAGKSKKKAASLDPHIITFDGLYKIIKFQTARASQKAAVIDAFDGDEDLMGLMNFVISRSADVVAQDIQLGREIDHKKVTFLLEFLFQDMIQSARAMQKKKDSQDPMNVNLEDKKKHEEARPLITLQCLRDICMFLYRHPSLDLLELLKKITLEKPGKEVYINSGKAPISSLRLLEKVHKVQQIFHNQEDQELRMKSMPPLVDLMETIVISIWEHDPEGSVQQLQDHLTNINDFCRDTESKDAKFTKRMLTYRNMLKSFLEPKELMGGIFNLGLELRKEFGTIDPEDEEETQVAHRLISNSTLKAAGQCWVTFTTEQLENVDHVYSLLKMLAPLETGKKFSASQAENDERDFTTDVLLERRRSMYKTAHGRMKKIFKVLDQLANCELKPPLRDNYIRLLTNSFKTINSAHKLHLSKKDNPHKRYEQIVEKLAETKERVNRLIEHLNQSEARTTKASVRRELQLIPALVFQIEEHEQLVLKVSSICKLDLARHVKRNEYRSFKIASKWDQANDEDMKFPVCSRSGSPVDQDEEMEAPKKSKKRARTGKDSQKEPGSQVGKRRRVKG